MRTSTLALALIPLLMVLVNIPFIDPSSWANAASALFCAAAFGWCVAMAVKS